VHWECEEQISVDNMCFIDALAWSRAINFVHQYQHAQVSLFGRDVVGSSCWSCRDSTSWKANFDGTKLGDWG